MRAEVAIVLLASEIKKFKKFRKVPESDGEIGILSRLQHVTSIFTMQCITSCKTFWYNCMHIETDGK